MKAKQRELKTSEQKMRTLIDTIPAVVLMKDRAYHYIMRVN